MKQQEIINLLTARISILVNEVNTLTKIIDGNVDAQSEVISRYGEMINQYKDEETKLRNLQMELDQALKYNINNHLMKVQGEKDFLGHILIDQKIDFKQGLNHPLYILCQEKILSEQKQRARQMELEKENALLLSENSRLRSYLEHDRYQKKIDQLTQQRRVIVAPDQPEITTVNYPQPNLLQYVNYHQQQREDQQRAGQERAEQLANQKEKGDENSTYNYQTKISKAGTNSNRENKQFEHLLQSSSQVKQVILKSLSPKDSKAIDVAKRFKQQFQERKQLKA